MIDDRKYELGQDGRPWLVEEKKMFYGHMGTQYPNTDILYVDSIKNGGIENLTGQSVEDFMDMVEQTGAKRIMFGMATLPRRAVPVEDVRLNSFIRKFVKATSNL